MKQLTYAVALAFSAFALGVVSGHTESALAQPRATSLESKFPIAQAVSPEPYYFSPAYLDPLIERYGESIPDAYFPPMPAVPGTMGPYPAMLAKGRRAFADALARQGYREKAVRVAVLSSNSLPNDLMPASGSSIANGPYESIESLEWCDNSIANICNYSAVWVRVKGDTECNGACTCHTNYVAWLPIDWCYGHGQEGWSDVDEVWSCIGDLRVGGTSKPAGTDAWHWNDFTYVNVQDDSGLYDVYLEGTGTNCSGCGWVGYCINCCN